MKSKPVFLGALVAGVLLLGAGLAGYCLIMATLGRADVAATQSCLSSVAAAIEKAGGSDFVEADRGPEWQVVTQPQVRQFLQRAGVRAGLSAVLRWRGVRCLGAAFGPRMETAEDGVWVKVSSVGRDGLPVTNDDVSVVVLLRGR